VPNANFWVRPSREKRTFLYHFALALCTPDPDCDFDHGAGAADASVSALDGAGALSGI
jgi:hypothetical protein